MFIVDKGKFENIMILIKKYMSKVLKINVLKICRFGNNGFINENIMILDIVFFLCNFVDWFSCEINLIRIKIFVCFLIFDVL